MAEESFTENLLRLVAAELHVLNVQIAGREMFGRGYYSLGSPERQAVDQAVLGMVSGNYGAITPEYLRQQEARPAVGFPTQASAPTSGKS